jgi:glycosyltransferase involved in cell wall biosynthesis
VPTLTAIVPATDSPSTLARCVEAIEGAQGPPEEVIVVSEPPLATPAAARNLGADRATGEVLAFVDADVVVHPDVFSRLRRAFEADPGLTAVFGSYDDSPEARGTVSRFRNLLHHHVHQSAAGQASTFWSGLGAVRRDAFADADGFDGARRFLEDVELGSRLLETGGRIKLDPAVQGTHLKEWTLAEMVRTDFARRGLPWLELALVSRAPTGALNLGWRHRLSALLCVGGLAAVVARRPLAAAGAAAGLVALNRDFYALLARRQGGAGAVTGVGLHALHHLTGVAAVPVGVALHLRRRPELD